MHRFQAKREHLTRVEGPLPESHGQNLALSVVWLYSFDNSVSLYLNAPPPFMEAGCRLWSGVTAVFGMKHIRASMFLPTTAPTSDFSKSRFYVIQKARVSRIGTNTATSYSPPRRSPRPQARIRHAGVA